MDVRELRCFLAVAEELHITRAAQRVYLSQPAMSRLISRIEQTVGTPLLDRSGPRLFLTPAGVAFADDAALLVRAFDRAVSRARAAGIEQRAGRRRDRHLRIGLLFPAAAELTAPIVAAYQSSHADVHLEFVDVAGLGGEQALTNGRVDVAFLWSPVAAQDVASVELFQDRFALLVANDHELANCGNLRSDDLSHARYTVTTTMSGAWQKASTLESWRSRPDLALPVRTVTDAMKAIASGAAVSIGPTSLARYAPVTGVRYIPLDVEGRPRSLLSHRRSDDRPATLEFVTMAAETARQLAPLVPHHTRPYDGQH